MYPDVTQTFAGLLTYYSKIKAEEINMNPFKQFSTFILFCLPSIVFAQDLPPANSLYVVTNCFLDEGINFDQALEEARGRYENTESSPNLVFFRRPIAGTNNAPNQFYRIVSWDNMQHWNQAVLQGNLSPTDLYECENQNRRFQSTRVVGLNLDTAYEDTDVAYVQARNCEVNPGISLSEVYTRVNRAVSEGQSERNADRTVAQLSNLILGGPDDDSAGLRVTIRRIGDSREGFAEFFDEFYLGTEDRISGNDLLSCRPTQMAESHVVHWKARGI